MSFVRKLDDEEAFIVVSRSGEKKGFNIPTKYRDLKVKYNLNNSNKEVYDVARTLTNSAKLTKETTKPALRLAAKKVIPNESYNKKKLGFPVPLREWIKEDDLYNKIKEAFSSDVAAKYFKQNKLLKLLENNRKGKSDNYKKIWTIYTFLVWYDEYFVKEG